MRTQYSWLKQLEASCKDDINRKGQNMCPVICHNISLHPVSPKQGGVGEFGQNFLTEERDATLSMKEVLYLHGRGVEKSGSSKKYSAM